MTYALKVIIEELVVPCPIPYLVFGVAIGGLGLSLIYG